MPFDLKQLEVAEVSLVDRAANRRKFLMFKHDSEDSVMKDLVLKVRESWAALLEHISKADEKLEAAIAKFDLSEKGRIAVHAALRALETAKEEMPQDIMRVLAELGGYDYPKPDQNKSEDSPFAKVMKMRKNESTGEDEPDYDALPEDSRPMVKALWSQIRALSKSSEESIATLQKAVKDHEATIAKEREERTLREAVAKADGYTNLPATAKELGGVFVKVDAALSKEEQELFYKVLKAGSEAVKQAHLTEQGRDGDTSIDANSVEGQLQAKAKEIQKRDKVTYETAYVKALDENPELAKAERAERERSAGRAA